MMMMMMIIINFSILDYICYLASKSIAITWSLSFCLSERIGWHQWLPSLGKYQEPSHLVLAKIHLLPTPAYRENIHAKI